MRACVSVRVWRAPEPCSLSGSRRRERTEAAAAARSPGPRNEAPTCPQLRGPASELIGQRSGSGLSGSPDAALGGPAPSPPVRPRCAPGKEFAWPSLRLSAQVAGTRGDPQQGREPRKKKEKEEGLAEKKPPLALAAPPTYSIAPAPRRKGEDEEEEEKEGRGWGGITGYKDRLGGWWKIFGLFSSVFS